VLVKNITVSVDDETYRRARVKAAELDTSVSALVKHYLNELAGQQSEFERLEAEELALRAQIKGFKAGSRLSREEVHDRRA
jgi:cell division protein FtsB